MTKLDIFIIISYFSHSVEDPGFTCGSDELFAFFSLSLSSIFFKALRYWHSIPDLKCAWYKLPGVFCICGRFTIAVRRSEVVDAATTTGARRGMFETIIFQANFEATLPPAPIAPAKRDAYCSLISQFL